MTWWYANWRELLETIGKVVAALIAAAGTVIAAVIGVRKKKNKQLSEKSSPSGNWVRIILKQLKHITTLRVLMAQISLAWNILIQKRI